MIEQWALGEDKLGGDDEVGLDNLLLVPRLEFGGMLVELGVLVLPRTDIRAVVVSLGVLIAVALERGICGMVVAFSDTARSEWRGILVELGVPVLRLEIRGVLFKLGVLIAIAVE